MTRKKERKETTEQCAPKRAQEEAPAAAKPSEETSVTTKDFEILQKTAQECESLRDQLLRARAEQDNIRKAARKERDLARDAAVADFAQDIFFVLDDLQRALDHLDEEDQETPNAKGIVLVMDKLLKALADRNVLPIDTKGALFDPAYHEAIATQPTSEVPPNTIIDEIRRGYTMNGRLIRASQVLVAVSVQAMPPGSEGE